MRITVFEASCAGNTTVKSPAVEVTVEPKLNTAIALFPCEALYINAPSAEIVKLLNTSSTKSTKAVAPDKLIMLDDPSVGAVITCPPDV